MCEPKMILTMKTSENNLNTKLITDILLLITFILTAILYLQYSQQIENEVATAILNSVQDIKGSIAEARSGR